MKIYQNGKLVGNLDDRFGKKRVVKGKDPRINRNRPRKRSGGLRGDIVRGLRVSIDGITWHQYKMTVGLCFFLFIALVYYLESR